jgi:hypothetical protein
LTRPTLFAIRRVEEGQRLNAVAWRLLSRPYSWIRQGGPDALESVRATEGQAERGTVEAAPAVGFNPHQRTQSARLWLQTLEADCYKRLDASAHCRSASFPCTSCALNASAVVEPEAKE